MSKMCTHGLEKYTPDLGPLGRGTNGVLTLSVPFYLSYRSKYNKLLISLHLGWWAQNIHYIILLSFLKIFKENHNSKRPQVT